MIHAAGKLGEKLVSAPSALNKPICDPKAKGDFYGAAEAYCVTLIYDASQNLQAQAKLRVQARF